MRNWLQRLWMQFHAWLNALLIKHLDVSETNEVVRVVTRQIGLTWVDMENHVEVRNTFFIPYHIEEVRLTYYNDAHQNIGYLHFQGPVRLGAHEKKIVRMPAKMSNITAFFNAARLLISDHIKTRTVGYTTIRVMGLRFKLPIDDIMVLDRTKIVTAEEDEATRLRKAEERRLRQEARRQRRETKKKEREARRMRLKNRHSRRKSNSRSGRSQKKEAAPEQEQPPHDLNAQPPNPPAAESEAPGPDISDRDR